MQRDDRITIPITEAMRVEASQAVTRLGKRGSPSTLLDTLDNDYIGDLAHQVVEKYLTQLGVPFTSTRLDVYTGGGDPLDIAILDKKIDIKGTRSPDDHFFVYSKNINNPSKAITDYLFVQLPRGDAVGYIYGLMAKSDFKTKGRLFMPAFGNAVKTECWGIALYKLTPFKNWVVDQPTLVEATFKHHFAKTT